MNSKVKKNGDLSPMLSSKRFKEGKNRKKTFLNTKKQKKKNKMNSKVKKNGDLSPMLSRKRFKEG